MTEQQNPYSAPASEVESVEMATDEFYSPTPWTASGRIGRLRYLAYNTAGFILLWLLISAGRAAAVGLGTAGIVFSFLTPLATIAFYVFLFIWGRRRLNDVGFSGWFQLISLIPLVNFIFFIYLILAPGETRNNKWGARPDANGALVVILGFAGPVLMVVGILAAIAIPAYSDYVDRTESGKYESEYSQELDSDDY